MCSLDMLISSVQMEWQQETISYPCVEEAVSHDTHPTLLSGEKSEIPSAAAVVQFLTVWDVDPSCC